MPEAIAILAHEMVDLIIHAGNPSRGSIAILMAVAANPAGHMNIGQGSPARSVNDFQKKKPEGTITAGQSKDGTGVARGKPPPPPQATARTNHRPQEEPTKPD